MARSRPERGAAKPARALSIRLFRYFFASVMYACCKLASHLLGSQRAHNPSPGCYPLDPSRRPVASVDPNRKPKAASHLDVWGRDSTRSKSKSKERKKCPRRASAPTTARPRRRRRRGSPSARSPSASCRDITSSTSTRLGARFLVACARDSTSGRGKARAQALAVHMRERGVRDADAACVRCECGS